MTFTTRFAPSPTGPLHLGHAYSACLAHDMAVREHGRFLLRIEDIDQTRSRPEWTTQIFDDLRWLGLTWESPVLHQNSQLPSYRIALKTLWKQKLLFVCSCNRRDILEALCAPQEGTPMGPDGIIYPGTCRARKSGQFADLPRDAVLRLDMRAAVGMCPGPFSFVESGAGPQGQTGQIMIPPAQLIDEIGDIVIARRDMGTSYHLSVVMDDAAQKITDVVRGQDLFDATAIHVLLQTLLGLPRPRYHHHDLIRDDTGKRLAKRDDARAISTYRDAGHSPQDVRVMIGLPL